MKTMQRRPVQRGDSVRLRPAVRLAARLAGVLAVMLAVTMAEAAPVSRTPAHARATSSRTATAEPRATHGKAAVGTRGVAARSGTKKAAAVGSKAGAGKAANARARAGKTATHDAKDSLKENRPRVQTKRRRGQKEEIADPPVTMWRVKGKAADAEPKAAGRQVAEDKSLTVEDFERAAGGANEATASAESDTTLTKSDAAKPLTRSAVRAGNERAAAEKVSQEKIAAADRMASRPAGARLPMAGPAMSAPISSAAKRSVVVRSIARPESAPLAVVAPAKATVLPQVQANGPRAAVMARATALPRLEASADVSDPVPPSTSSEAVKEIAANGGDVKTEALPKADIFSQSGLAQSVAARDEVEDAAALPQASIPLRQAPMSLRAPTHEEMAEAVTQPVVLPGLYRDGRLVMPAPLKGTREILVHQNTMADAEGLQRIQNESELNRLRAAHELVNLPESESLRLNPELTANRRCARVWSVKFAEDMSRAFYAKFDEPLKVTSAVRTVAYQLRLQRVNGNAAGIGGEMASPHLTGQALDFAKSGMSVAEIAWMRGYLLPLMQAGKVDVEEEFQQACFHISVYKSYLPSVPARRRGARMEVAQLKSEPVRPVAKPMRALPPTEDDRQ